MGEKSEYEALLRELVVAQRRERLTEERFERVCDAYDRVLMGVAEIVRLLETSMSVEEKKTKLFAAFCQLVEDAEAMAKLGDTSQARSLMAATEHLRGAVEWYADC